MNYYSKMASAVVNNIRSGLVGYHHNPTLSRDQVEDELIWTRMKLIKDYILKGIIPIKELMLTMRCIDVDCKDLDRCRCSNNGCGVPIAHFEIPQVFTDMGNGATIRYVGTTDMMKPFNWFTDLTTMKYSQYGRRGQSIPRVYIDTSPNENNLYDCFIFNAPLIKQVTVQAIFKDPRQIYLFDCCDDTFSSWDLTTNLSFMDKEIMKVVTNDYINYYKRLREPVQPNDQAINKP